LSHKLNKLAHLAKYFETCAWNLTSQLTEKPDASGNIFAHINLGAIHKLPNTILPKIGPPPSPVKHLVTKAATSPLLGIKKTSQNCPNLKAERY
jgi:hypothetical protein